MVRWCVAGESMHLLTFYSFLAGGVGHTVMSSYSGAVFAVGGSGVSFALSAVPDLIQAATGVKVIDIIWSVQDPCTYHLLTHFP